MKKYICIATLTLANTAWSMEEKHSSKTINPNSLEVTLRSFQTDADRKKGRETLDTINEKTGIISPKTSPQNFSPSPLFVVHNKYSDNRPSKL